VTGPSCATRWRRWSATGCPTAAPTFSARLIRALGDRFDPEEAFDLAVDNAATFYLAGHETTANAITWTLYLLSEQPELQDEGAPGRAALAAGEENCFASACRSAGSSRSMRIYPPVPRFDRQAVTARRPGGPAATSSIWPWLLHRHRALWDDPATPIPTASPEAKEGRHRFQYIPFGGGPRLCVAPPRRRRGADCAGALARTGPSRRSRGARPLGDGDVAAGRWVPLTLARRT
jgi:cytochrome P450